MDVPSLLNLRKRVDETLAQHRTKLEKELRELDGGGYEGGGRRGGVSSLKGRKVPPKYRGPRGETWAGRGATPRWLVALVKEGRKKEEFAVDKGAAMAARKKRVVKRGRRRKK